MARRGRESIRQRNSRKIPRVRILSALLIIGAGGHAKVVVEAAQASGHWQDIALLDDNYPTLQELLGRPVIGPIAQAQALRSRYLSAAIAIGASEYRLELLEKLSRIGFSLPSVIHPRAWVSPSAQLADGCVVLAQAAINAEAKLGPGCIVNTCASVDHDCQLADGVHIAPGAHLAAGVQVGHKSWIGVGASVRQQIVIGQSVMVGAGSVVVTNIADGAIVMGVPAKEQNPLD